MRRLVKSVLLAAAILVTGCLAAACVQSASGAVIVTSSSPSRERAGHGDRPAIADTRPAVTDTERGQPDGGAEHRRAGHTGEQLPGVVRRFQLQPHLAVGHPRCRGPRGHHRARHPFARRLR